MVYIFIEWCSCRQNIAGISFCVWLILFGLVFLVLPQDASCMEQWVSISFKCALVSLSWQVKCFISFLSVDNFRLSVMYPSTPSNVHIVIVIVIVAVNFLWFKLTISELFRTVVSVLFLFFVKKKSRLKKTTTSKYLCSLIYKMDVPFRILWNESSCPYTKRMFIYSFYGMNPVVLDQLLISQNY